MGWGVRFLGFSLWFFMCGYVCVWGGGIWRKTAWKWKWLHPDFLLNFALKIWCVCRGYMEKNQMKMGLHPYFYEFYIQDVVLNPFFIKFRAQDIKSTRTAMNFTLKIWSNTHTLTNFALKLWSNTQISTIFVIKMWSSTNTRPAGALCKFYLLGPKGILRLILRLIWGPF